jgi:hypothetical protein
MKANKMLQATVFNVFFLGLSTGSLLIGIFKYLTGDGTWLSAACTLAAVAVTGTISVSCYMDLRSRLKSIEAHEPKPEHSQPDQANEGA